MSVADLLGIRPKYEVTIRPPDNVTVKVIPTRGPAVNVELTMDQYNRFLNWRNGELIQVALHDLPKETREIFQTGITPEKWKQVFGT